MVLGGFPDWSGGDWSVLTGNVGGRLNQARCIDIPVNMSLCHGIGYAQMRLPNLLDHDSVQEATQQSSRYICIVHLIRGIDPEVGKRGRSPIKTIWNVLGTRKRCAQQ